MADSTLRIKDGNGDPQDLYVDEGDSGLVPYHAISGAVNVNVTFPDTQPVSFEATSALTASISNFPPTQSVSLANTGSLTASISNLPATQSVSFAASSVLTASIYNLPLTQSVSLVNTGSLTASLSAADMTTLTASISAVSSAVAHSLDKFIAGLLDNGSSSFNVDIVAGDVNTLTQSIGYVKDEVAKLTALSSSDGLKVYTLLTSSVNIANASSLTASVSFATSSALTASINNWPTYVNPAVIVETRGADCLSRFKSYSELTSSIGILNFEEYIEGGISPTSVAGLIIYNKTNADLYITLDESNPSPTNWSLVIEPYSLYEATAANRGIYHYYLLDSSASLGNVAFTVTRY